MTKENKIFDISMSLSAAMPVWPGSEKFILTWLQTIDKDGVNESKISLNSHTGTHIDTPFHFILSGNKTGDIRLTNLIGPAVVLDCTDETEITVDFLNKADISEKCDKLLLKTSNSAENLIEQNIFCREYAALNHDCAKWVFDRNIHLIGIDYLSIEKYPGENNIVHKTLLGNNIVILEGLNLRDIDEGEYELIALPLKIPDCEGAPVRAVLIKNIGAAETAQPNGPT